MPHSTTTHGLSKLPEYKIWKGMRSRCTTPSDTNYYHYGANGIRVCERWSDFAAFMADMGPRPTEKHSIDRIDSKGNYEPGNCRWATWAEQCANRSNAKLIEFRGETLSLTEWAVRLGMKRTCVLANRLRRGWSVERALTTPP